MARRSMTRKSFKLFSIWTVVIAAAGYIIFQAFGSKMPAVKNNLDSLANSIKGGTSSSSTNTNM